MSKPEIVWPEIVGNVLIALSLFVIVFGLLRLANAREELRGQPAIRVLAAAIGLLGLTHLVGSLLPWVPVAVVFAVLTLASGVVLVIAKFGLWTQLSRLIAVPVQRDIDGLRGELAAMTAERDAAIASLRAESGHREAAEAALLQSQKLEAVGQLTGGIAHDFNNLLQAVSGNLELISRRPDDPDKVVRWTAGALDAVERGRSLTAQLLAFSRRQRLDLSSVRLVELFGGMRDLLEKAVAPLVRVRVAPVDPTWNVEADALQLELAILNLAFNARDAMPAGGTLTISAQRCNASAAPGLEPGDYVAITLADTGSGMTPDVKARALEPFFTTKGPGQGTGMGLSMAFGVATQSGGTLTVESEFGRGTSVTLFLRLSALEPARALDVGDDAPRRIDLTGRTIALVDDDDAVRQTLVDTLRNAGARVEEAHSGATGLALVHSVSPDLLIVDYAMPGMSGAEVAQELRAEGVALPILVVTGYADSDKLDSIQGAQVAVLHKPFESSELLRRVAELVEG